MTYNALLPGLDPGDGGAGEGLHSPGRGQSLFVGADPSQISDSKKK